MSLRNAEFFAKRMSESRDRSADRWRPRTEGEQVAVRLRVQAKTREVNRYGVVPRRPRPVRRSVDGNPYPAACLHLHAAGALNDMPGSYRYLRPDQKTGALLGWGAMAVEGTNKNDASGEIR